MLKFLSLVLFVSSALAASEEERVFGGEDATDTQFPHQARIRYDNKSYRICGGSIISDRFVLTAAHCTIGRWSIPANVHVLVGPKFKGKKYALDTIVNHPNYGPGTLDNDISVLRTAKKITFSKLVKSIALPKHDAAGRLLVTIIGWGKFEVGCFTF